MSRNDLKLTNDDQDMLQEPIIRDFDIHREAIAGLKRPNIEQYTDVKTRMTVLENIVSGYQDDVNPLNLALIDDLNCDLYKVESKILELFARNQVKVEKEIAELRRHHDHRFDLQIADNLRNIQHISSLKAENNQLRKKLDQTSKKLQRLQSEFDGGESGDPEPDEPDQLAQTFPNNITYNFNAERRGTSPV